MTELEHKIEVIKGFNALINQAMNTFEEKYTLTWNREVSSVTWIRVEDGDQEEVAKTSIYADNCKAIICDLTKTFKELVLK